MLLYSNFLYPLKCCRHKMLIVSLCAFYADTIFSESVLFFCSYSHCVCKQIYSLRSHIRLSKKYIAFMQIDKKTFMP